MGSTSESKSCVPRRIPEQLLQNWFLIAGRPILVGGSHVFPCVNSDKGKQHDDGRRTKQQQIQIQILHDDPFRISNLCTKDESRIQNQQCVFGRKSPHPLSAKVEPK
jgi:hypothetical protein